MADAQDLKSWVRKKTCGFESHHRHHFSFEIRRVVDFPEAFLNILAPDEPQRGVLYF
jgi:hypothetical protein